MVACTRGFLAVLTATISLFAAAPAVAVPLLGEWKFDEGAGQVAADSSPSGLPARLGIASGPDGADPSWVPGVSGSALRFDGGDAVIVPDSLALEPGRISVETWVRRQGTPGRFAYVLSKGSVGCVTSSYGLYTGNGGGMAFYVSMGSTSYVVSPAAAPARIWDGDWHQVVGSYDGRSVRLYIDGVEVGSGAPDTQPIVYGLVSSAPYIGTYRGGCELGFTGDIDTVRIWGQALTPPEIAALLRAQPPGGGGGGGGVATVLAPVSGPPPKGAPSCVASSARETVRARRRTTLVVTVRRNGKPLGRVRVLLRGTKTRLVRTTDARGRVRFVVRPQRAEKRLQVRVVGRSCQNTSVTVLP
jgi:Concanavalin A-like lectin/glucanases superfamily